MKEPMYELTSGTIKIAEIPGGMLTHEVLEKILALWRGKRRALTVDEVRELYKG